MHNLYEKAEAARYFIQNQLENIQLDSCIITGTGLGEIWKELSLIETINYSDIPHFSKNTVRSHAGQLHICQFNSKNVAILSGRFHYYEGFDSDEVAFPVRVMKLLGINKIMITNVAGGLNENYQAGSIVALVDHINIQPSHVLRGFNDTRFGPRFPDMMNSYDLDCIDKMDRFARSKSIKLHRGVYLGLQGPSLETPAEYRFLKTIGADLVGMSTVPEVIAAVHMEMKVFALSVVSNVCYPIEHITKTTVEEVISVAKKAIPSLNILIKEWI